MAWEKSGTISVTNGSATITGVGTDWFDEGVGSWLHIDGDPFPYEVVGIASDSTLTVDVPVERATATGLRFRIVPTQGEIRPLRQKIQNALDVFTGVLEDFSLGGFVLWQDQPGNEDGTVAEYLASLQGKSAYQVWLDEGNTGTAQDYLDSQKGGKGDDGKSAYQVWLDEGNTGTEQDYLDDTSAGAVTATAANVTAAQTAQGLAEAARDTAQGHATQTGQDRQAVENLFDNLDDRFLGSKASDPTTDNDGDPLIAGARYWNTTAGEGRIYNGTAWEAPSTSATASAQDALAAKTAAETARDVAQTAQGDAETARDEAEEARDLAEDHAAAAGLASNATEWVSGGSFVAGQIVWTVSPPGNFRSLSTHSGRTTHPATDTAFWFDLGSGSGDMPAATYDPQNIADDAFDRANHTGAQAISTVTGLQEALDGKQAGLAEGPFVDGDKIKLDSIDVSGGAGLEIGDILTTGRDPGAGYLRTNGAVYLQSAYPDLFATIGLQFATWEDPVTVASAATTPPQAVDAVAWSPDGRYLALGHTFSPRITIYDWSSGSPIKIADPAIVPGGTIVRGLVWSPSGRYLAVVYNSSPFVTIYDWDTGSPVKISDPATLPAGDSYGCSWSPDGRYLVIGHINSPYITIYDWDSGSPVKASDPATLPPEICTDSGWSPDGRYLAVPSNATPRLVIYDWQSGSPVKIADPASLPLGTPYKATWSPDGRYLAVAHASSPIVTIYDWISGSPVKIADPATLPTGVGFGVAWSPDGRYLAVAHSSSPYITIYDWISGSPVKIDNPGTLVSATANDASWSPNGRYLALGHDSAGDDYYIVYDGLTGIDPDTEFAVPNMFLDVPTYIKAEDV